MARSELACAGVIVNCQSEKMEVALEFGPYYRYIGEHNAGEYEKVIDSMEVWGTEARCLAHGLRVQALPVGLARSDSGYNFRTEVVPTESLGFPLVGPHIVREVYWQEGAPGVEYREAGRYVSIAVHTVKLGRT